MQRTPWIPGSISRSAVPGVRIDDHDRTGLAEMSDEKSNLGDYQTRIEAVPEGFEIKGDDVICSVCQVSAL